MMYRNKAILDRARHFACQVCGRDDGTIVAAHSNQLRHGKGKGLKAHDCFVGYACGVCHDLIDSSKLPRDVRVSLWKVAHERSVPLFAHLLDDDGWRVLQADGGEA